MEYFHNSKQISANIKFNLPSTLQYIFVGFREIIQLYWILLYVVLILFDYKLKPIYRFIVSAVMFGIAK